jgi:hypothetical protein
MCAIDRLLLCVPISVDFRAIPKPPAAFSENIKKPNSHEARFPELLYFDGSAHCLAQAVEPSSLFSVDCALFDVFPKEQLSYFDRLAHSSLRSLANVQQSTPLFSCAPALFVKNTREGGIPPGESNP